MFIPASLGGRSEGGGRPVQRREEQARAFELLHEDALHEDPVLAPVLHAASSERHIPLGYGSDFAEFLRAYRTRFAHDLETEAAGEQSRARFAELLRLLEAEPELDGAAAIERVYGLPLSAAEPGEGDLEGRFLEWLR